MAVNRNRSKYTDAQKTKSVARVISGQTTVTKEAQKLGLSWQSVHVWCSKPEFGGSPDYNRKSGAAADPASPASSNGAAPPAVTEGRRIYPLQTRLDVVARRLNGESIAALAAEFGVKNPSTIHQWISRYRDTQTATEPGLPTTVRKGNYGARPKALVATSFSCPHCGGPITK